LTYADVGSGVDQVRYTNAHAWGSELWEDPVVSKVWTLESGDGIKYVSYQIRDNMGLISHYFDSINLDTTPPTGSIIINNGDATTTSTTVTLTLTYSEPTSGVDKVRYTNADAWGPEPWEDPTPTKSWILEPGVGEKHVSYQVRDNSGITSHYFDFITLEPNAPPTISIITGPTSGYREDTITITATASDPNEDELTYEWKIDQDPFDETSSTLPFTIEDDPNAVGPHIISVRAKDPNGGVSDWKTMDFTTLNRNPTVESITGPTSGYSDQAYAFNATGQDQENDTLTYEWQVDGLGKSETNSLSHTFGLADSLGSHTIMVRVKDQLDAYSDWSNLTFNLLAVDEPEPLIASVTPTSTTITTEEEATFTMSASGGTSPYTYQWYEGTNAISGETSTQLTVSKSSAGSYSYYCKVTDSESATSNSNTVTLTVNEVSLPLEYVGVGIAAIVGVAIAIFLLRRK
jgi:hypothetical protein